MKLYQVVDWQKNFENDRSRKIDHCSFVCVPNKQHGMGFCRIMNEPDGAAIYGIWAMILGACSQQSRPRDGWLTSNGEQSGSAWGVGDLSLKFRRPIKEIDRAMSFLASDSVGWLRFVESLTGNSPSTHGELTLNSPSTPLEGRKEGRKEQKEDGAIESPPTSCDSEWVAELSRSEAYRDFDVNLQLKRMIAWCEVNHKRPTRRRLINWLNRCEKPLNAKPKGGYVPNI